MKSESDPITDDEWLLRRVHKDRFRTDRVPLISITAFEPRIKGRDRDIEGISLYREACLKSPDEILVKVAADKQRDHGIVRISVAELRRLNLTVVSNPDEILGHVVVPELNALVYEQDKAKYTPTLEKLATFASKDERIVREPPSL